MSRSAADLRDGRAPVPVAPTPVTPLARPSLTGAWLRLTARGRQVPGLAYAVVTAVSYSAAVAVGLALRPPHATLAVFWPAAGVGVGLLIRASLRSSPRTPYVGVVAGILIATLIVNAAAGDSPGTIAALCAVNVISAMAGAWTYCRVWPLDGITPILRILVAGAAAALSASLLALILVLPQVATWNAWELFRDWTLRDITGVVIVLPIVLAARAERPRTGWLVAQVLATAVLGATAFLWLRPEPLGFLLLPGLIWAAWLGPRWSASCLLVAGGLATLATLHGDGPYGDITPIRSAAMLCQLFVLVLTITTLTLAYHIAQHARLAAVAESHDQLRQSEKRLSISQRVARVGTAEQDMRTGRTLWTDGMYRLHGAEPGSFDIGPAAFQLVHPDDRDRVVAALNQRSRSNQPLEFSYRIIGLDGQIRHLRSVDVREYDALGRPTRVIVTAMDVTDSVIAQAKVAASEQLFRTAFASAPIGMVMCDVAEQCAIVDANAAFCEFLGRDRSSVLGRSIFAFNHPDDEANAREQLSVLLAGDASTIQFEKRFLRADGSSRWSRVTASLLADGHGGIRTTIAQVEDVTERRVAEERLVHQAGHDALTGLPNRMLLVDRLDHALSRRTRHPDALVGVIFLDLDNFKTINDSLGHAVGDALLVSVSKRIASLIRPSDTLARFGGDEFVLALEDLTGVGQAEALAGRISAALRHPLRVDGKQLMCSVSMGLAICGEGANTPDELLRNADTALYRAKQEGRGRHVLFAHALHQEVLRQLQTAGELRRALVEEQLRLHFQPVVDLVTNTVVGYEALIRWEHPHRGLLFPGEFLDVAHREKMTEQIGTWVLGEALRQLAIWRRAGHEWSVAVNVSPPQLDSGFVGQVADALREADLSPSHLILEMTEEAVVGDVTGTVNVLADLQRLGVRVAIDDFGTGYSSLSYVRNLPLSSIKIDRSFLTDLESDPRHVSVVQAIVDLAHGLGLAVVAEGVETWQQRSVLTKLGVEMGQGYLFSPALPPVNDPAGMLANVRLPIGPSPLR